jgi:hypothetical protein
MGIGSAPSPDVIMGGTINPAPGEHKPWRRDLLFQPMYRCGIVHRIHVERKSPGEREGET